MSEQISVLFVCLGNICRSPLAEGIFLQLLREDGLEERVHVDSAGTGAWHVGERPDARSIEVARRHGVELRGYARRVEGEDFSHFDYIVAMDGSNHRTLETMRGRHGGSARLHLLREFDGEEGKDLDVPDPYYGGPSGFEHVYQMVDRSCRGLLLHITSPSPPN